MENRFLAFQNVAKHFGDCIANREISFSVQKGSIHAIVGENGAGKSTAMKMLYGQYPPSSGEIYYKSKHCQWRSPHDAIRSGIGMVHQHFMLAGTHTALENILLGLQRWPISLPKKVEAKNKLNSIMKQYGIFVDLEVKVDDCPVGVQQRIEILKLLYRDSEVLILDEPTAVLARSEVETFFSLLRKMASLGKTILIITHKLKEVMALADRVTVFRAGMVVAEREIAQTSISELASLMVGQEVHLVSNASKQIPGDIFIESKNLSTKNHPNQTLNFQIRSGEILGIAGVEGNGQSDLIKALLSPKNNVQSGTIFWKGKEISKFSSEEIRQLGFAVLPEDRLREGLLLHKSILENFILRWRSFSDFRRYYFLRLSRLYKTALEEMNRYSVRPMDLEIDAGSLSGGNQQKMVVARELYGDPQFLLAAQPTRGVDIGSVQFIHEKILEKKAGGAAILLVSSELDEVLKLADRVLVMYRGNFVAEFLRGNFDEQKIGFFMIGGEKAI